MSGGFCFAWTVLLKCGKLIFGVSTPVSRKLLTLKKTTKEGIFMQKNKTSKMVKIALIAAIYATISIAMFFISFGVIQFRVSEALTVLPAFTGLAVPGLTLGCCMANLIGFFIGANPIGLIDAIVGSMATLLAGITSFHLGKLNNKTLKYILVPLPPVLFNAVIIGAELTLLFNGNLATAPFVANAISVLIGQAVICYVLGVPLMYLLDKNDLYRKIFK